MAWISSPRIRTIPLNSLTAGRGQAWICPRRAILSTMGMIGRPLATPGSLQTENRELTVLPFSI